MQMPFGLLNYTDPHPLDTALMPLRVVEHSTSKYVPHIYIHNNNS